MDVARNGVLHPTAGVRGTAAYLAETSATSCLLNCVQAVIGALIGLKMHRIQTLILKKLPVPPNSRAFPVAKFKTYKYDSHL